MAKQRKPARPKRVLYTLIPEWEESGGNHSATARNGPYRLLDELVGQYHPELAQARIALCWRHGLKEDRDGKLILGQCRKASELSKEFAEYDYVICLNDFAWTGFTDLQKRALLSHELCHAAPVLGDDGEQKRDERDRLLWRIRKHDLEEFSSVVRTFGLWKKDLEAFARAIRDGQKSPLFAQTEGS